MQYKTTNSVSYERIKELKKLLIRIGVSQNKLDELTSSDSKYIAIIDEALTHTSAKHKVNHERLEFLGDAVLRLAASEFIDRKFPEMTVGERSELRSQIVSDNWLTTVGKDIKIMDFFIIGSKAAGDNSAQETMEAEATEALIGSIYECWKNIEPIHKWLTPYWLSASNDILADPHKKNFKSALQEWSQRKGLGHPQYESEERSQIHGDPLRFFCKVNIESKQIGEGWGGSRRDAEKSAARIALEKIYNSKNNP